MKIQSVQTSPPTPSIGDAYIIGASATGAWSGKDRKIAIARSTSGDWLYKTPTTGETVTGANGSQYVYNGTVWLRVVATPTLGFYSNSSTAAGDIRTGWVSTTTSEALTTPPAGHRLLVVGVDYHFETGATGGSYTVHIIAESSSGDIFTAASPTTEENTDVRGSSYGSIASPLAVINGDTYTSAYLRVGWKNDATSPGALAAQTHSAFLHCAICAVI